MSKPRLSQQKLPLPITPRGGAIGSVVSLSATGLPPQRQLIIAFANLQMYQLLQRVETDGDGSFSTAQVVPDWAHLDVPHYFFASFSDEIPLALSSGFHVTSPEGIARVRGVIGDRSDGCVDLRDAKDELYHLVGDAVGDRKQGESVSLVGTIGDPALCPGKGIVIAVTQIAALAG